MANLVNHKNGFVWYEGKLQSYEFRCAEFEDGKCEHHCYIGGKAQVLGSASSFMVWATEEDFKADINIEPTNITLHKHHYGVGGWSHSENTFAVVNGKVVEPELTHFFVDKELNVSFPDYDVLYGNEDEAKLYCSYDIVDENGNVTHRKSVAEERAFSDEQNDVLSRLCELLKEANDKGIMIASSEGELYAYNDFDKKLEWGYFHDCDGQRVTDLNKHLCSIHTIYDEYVVALKP